MEKKKNLHRIDALDDDENLIPRSASARLTVGDGLSNHLLQLREIVVFELFPRNKKENNF